MTDEEQKQAQGGVGEALYYTARSALACGLSRSEYAMLADFWWAQAASDHAQIVAAEALAKSGRSEP